jgi:DNA-directed RNA polymerase specialized sigma24 family protein
MVNQAGADVDLLLEEAARTLSRFRHQIPACVQEELGQESVARVLAASSVLVPPAFVRRVARNLAIDWLRQRRQQEGHEDAELCPDRSWQQQVERHLEVERVRVALAEAPAPYRRLLEALVFDELDVEDLVAAELLERGQEPGDPQRWGLARDTVYKRRARALSWLRRRLSEG